MKVGDIGETVEVTGAARLLESDSSDRGQVISREQIVNLPLTAAPTPTSRCSAPASASRRSADSRDASFNVNGLRSSLNNFILDGVDNNSYGTSNQGFSNQVVQVSPDAVEEFKVQTNNFSAEFGRAGGAVINATFRSGTNQFRGTAWEFNRNTALNATGFFKPSSGVKPTLNRNQFGGVFGGPIVRDRAFFFANYEGFRQVQRTVTFASIPTMAQRQGIMGKPVVNPLTGEVYADGVIPQSAITPFARKVLAGLPGADARRHLEQLRHAAAPPGLQRQVRRQGRSAVQHERRPRSCASAIARWTTSSRRRFRARRAARRTPSSRCSTSRWPAASRARSGTPRSSKSASACRAPKPARPRSAPARRTCSRPTASPACRPTRTSPAA